MDDASPPLSEDPPPFAARSEAITNSHEPHPWKSRMNDRLHLEAQRRSLDHYIGRYLSLRRDIWSEYGCHHSVKEQCVDFVKLETNAFSP